MQNILESWKRKMGLSDWQISIVNISPNQVLYPRDIGKDKYFIGVAQDYNLKRAVIYHDVELNEESIVHELLHIVYPTKSESWINKKTISLNN